MFLNSKENGSNYHTVMSPGKMWCQTRKDESMPSVALEGMDRLHILISFGGLVVLTMHYLPVVTAAITQCQSH